MIGVPHRRDRKDASREGAIGYCGRRRGNAQERVMTEDGLSPRLSIVTLGVASVAKSRAFYEALGWRASSASQETIAFFQLSGVVLALFNRNHLADDATVAPAGKCRVSSCRTSA